MNILLLNQNWFKEDFEAAGHRVVTCGISKHLDIGRERPLFHIRDALAELPEKFEPDLVLMHDNSAPLVILGLHELECPKLFYSVDIHHHYELHCNLSSTFEQTLIAQKDYAAEFEQRHLPKPGWLPLWASRYVEPSEDKKFGAVFVGTMKRELNPARVEFFEALQNRTQIHCTTGLFWEIFPRSEVIVNQTVKGDLNFRVFEGLMCGATLLTEMTGNGLGDLFTQWGEHLVTYEKGNVEDAAQKIEYLLGDLKACRRIAESGRAEVLRAHLSEHRAAELLSIIDKMTSSSLDRRHYGLMVNFIMLTQRFEKLDDVLAMQSVVEAIRMLELGLQRQERMTEEIAFFAVLTALTFDRRLNATQGSVLLDRLQESYPSVAILRAARLRNLLNAGKINEAKGFANLISPHQEPESTFIAAENIISTVLGSKET